jgi:transcriptional adapter 2-alpha
MPRREDFDIEHDNDAEHLIADMEFSAEDTKEDQNLKVEVIKIFNSKLDERERRKKFILDKKLMNYRENQEEFQKLPADERHLIHRMRLFERFHSIEEHKIFVDNILKAKRLRKEIAKLQTYRRLGITSLAEAQKYELDKSRREYHKMAWLKKEAETKKAEADAARQAKENASDPSMNGLDGGIGAAANQSLGIWKQYNQDSPSKRRRITEGAENEPASVEATEGDAGKSSNEAPVCGDKKTEEPSSDFTLEDKAGFERLSPKEKELCRRLQLLPQHYLDVKRALISESLAAGIYDPSSRAQKGKIFVTIDVSKTDDIIDFVLKAGWISTRPTVKPILKEETSV